jgi:hypothetical protein
LLLIFLLLGIIIGPHRSLFCLFCLFLFKDKEVRVGIIRHVEYMVTESALVLPFALQKSNFAKVDNMIFLVMAPYNVSSAASVIDVNLAERPP